MTDAGSSAGGVPPPTPKGLFISYRRGETSGQARALHDRLSDRFAGHPVFMDVDSIFPGEHFEESIEAGLAVSGVFIALIGHDWLTSDDAGTRMRDDPGDFVRLEVEMALERQVPVIPILVERTSLPDSQDLPESLLPLRKVQAMDLENSRWESDVARLLRRVEMLVVTDPIPPPIVPPTPPPAPIGGGETAPTSGSTVRSKKPLVIAGVALALIAGVVAVVAVATRTKPDHGASAEKSVAAVPNENLMLALLNGQYTPAEIPAGVGHPTVRLWNVPGTTGGLAAYIRDTFSRPGILPSADFELYDSPTSAQSNFSGQMVSTGYRQTGTFDAPGISDAVRCITELLPAGQGIAAQSQSVCEVLSGYVKTYVVTANTDGSGHGDNALTAALARDAVEHLARIAAATPQTKSSPGSITPAELSSRLLGTEVVTNEFPPELSAPRAGSVAKAQVPGILSEIRVSFSGPDTEDFIRYFVFDTAASAQAWYTPNLTPGGSSVTGTIASSGFDEATACRTYSNPGGPTLGPPVGQSACYVLTDNVVIETTTSSVSNLKGANDSLAVILARVALIHLHRASSAGG